MMLRHHTSLRPGRGSRGFPWRYCCLLAGLWFGQAAFAQDDEDEEKDEVPEALKDVVRRYASVEEWQGFWEAEDTGAKSGNAGGSMREISGYYNKTTSGRFTLRRDSYGWEPKRAMFRWIGESESRVSELERHAAWSLHGVGSESQAVSSGAVHWEETHLTIWLLNKHADWHPGAPGKGLDQTVTGRSAQEQTSNGRVRLVTKPINEVNVGAAYGIQPLSGYGRAGEASHEFDAFPFFQGGPGVISLMHGGPTNSAGWIDNYTGTYRSRMVLFPVYDNLEVEVTIKGYAEWRPKGSIADPTKPGNDLTARATLKRKDGTKAGGLPPVKRFRFELLDTSSEPGVCLNWPLEAKDKDFDLRLASAGTGGTPSATAQKMDVRDPLKDDQQRPYAEATVESLDFGGRAELRVICELSDGREIVGLLKDEAGEQDLVRLPKMKGPGWVAEAWRKEWEVPELPDNDDHEEVDGQQHKGDGFTLYEEYRGFVENGKHISGDPKRKDFFILNQIGEGGADAIGGIKLFERVSKLVTHHRLRATEMSTAARLMNGNHREAPRHVGQHGIWMYNADGTGIPAGGTVGLTREDAGRAFRPGRVNHVVVESPGINDAIFGHDRSVGEYKLGERDAAFAYDRAVAHELLHAVGVDHHGEGEDPSTFYFVAASDPNNPSHRVGFSQQLPRIYDNIDLSRSPDHVYDGNELNRRELETLIWEDTGRNIAEELAPLYERKLAAERARRAANPPTGEYDAGRRATQFPQYGRSEFYWRETDTFDAVAYLNHEFSVFATIGELNKADSGNELCLMRYYFATAYPVAGKARTYYVVRPGQNRAGRSICQSPAGTEANAPSHQPQSRFGDSAPNRGNCFGDICPNDDIPPRNLH